MNANSTKTAKYKCTKTQNTKKYKYTARRKLLQMQRCYHMFFLILSYWKFFRGSLTSLRRARMGVSTKRSSWKLLLRKETSLTSSLRMVGATKAWTSESSCQYFYFTNTSSQCYQGMDMWKDSVSVLDIIHILWLLE